MSALSTSAIRARLDETTIENRLVISPILDEAEQIKDGQASIDVRLGSEFRHVSASSFGAIGEFASDAPPFAALYRRQYVPLGASITIHPHQFLLAQTLEYIRLPPDLMAYVVGRSTWGRLGLIVATAVGIHPNFAGSLTLELRNLGETPLTLYPAQTIAQLFFHRVLDAEQNPAVTLASKAQYCGTTDMVPKRISSETTKAGLSKLIERYEARLKQ